MKKILSRSIIAFTLALALTFTLGLNYQEAHAAGVSVWWPTNNAQVTGTQPFKARVDGMSLGDYSIYWQVDNGQLNSMSDNNTDAPHKEASVDLSGWHWQPSGTYQINFVAKDKNGNTIGTQSETIHTNATGQPTSNSTSSSQPTTQTTTTSSNSSNPAPTTTTTSANSSTSGSTSTTPPSTTSTGDSSAGNSTSNSPTTSTPLTTGTLTPPSYPNNISTWWPIDGSHMKGVQPFKALVDNMPLSSYSMYWQVDGGQFNQMSDNSNGGPHKETSVDLTNWNWHGSGPYAITFIARNSSGSIIASKTVNIYLDNQTSASAPTNTTPGSTPVTNPVTTPATPTPTPVTTTPTSLSIAPVSTGPNRSGDPLSGINLYVDPSSDAALQAQTWATSQPTNAALMMKIASEPVGKWFGGWNSNIQSDTAAYVNAAASSNSVPVFIAYNIPFRDCGGYSAGGATTPDAYNAWIKGMAQGIGSNKAVVILEPDALAGITCLSQSDQSARYVMLQNAVATLKANKNTSVYIDAGNSNWTSATDMAPRLKNAGVGLADGFALNVSNFYQTSDLTNFGNTLSPLVSNKHYVVDTSRNGLGPNGSEWCNPLGRALGNKPTSQTGNSLADAFLWLKTPGESDGNCNGGPNAGVWWPDYAVGLSQRAAY